MREFVAIVFVVSIVVAPLIAISRAFLRRIPWLLIGLVGRFMIGSVVDPGYYSPRIWREEPWRYYVGIWGPLAGVAGGVIVDVWLQLLRQGAIIRATQAKEDAP